MAPLMPTNETPSAGATSYSKLINACENSGHERPLGYPCAKCIALAFDAFACERLTAQAQLDCPLCHCCGEKRHDGGDPCVACESVAREREAAVWRDVVATCRLAPKHMFASDLAEEFEYRARAKEARG